MCSRGDGWKGGCTSGLVGGGGRRRDLSVVGAVSTDEFAVVLVLVLVLMLVLVLVVVLVAGAALLGVPLAVAEGLLLVLALEAGGATGTPKAAL